MLALNRSFFNAVINILKSLASIISMCNINVFFSWNITPKYVNLLMNGMFRPFIIRRDSVGTCLGEKILEIFL
jgi:hypothetical protein